jgi:hypothetical protein
LALPTINESEPPHFPLFDVLPQPQMQHPDIIRESVNTNIQMSKTDPSCSVCGRSFGALAILEPCGHPLCSTCLTSALNIVGEKDMECAVCKLAVEDFYLQNSPDFSTSAKIASSAQSTNLGGNNVNVIGKSFFDTSPTASPLRRGTRTNVGEVCMGLLPSAFEMHTLGVGGFFDGARGASTPVPGRQNSATGNENAVLRIDNVPWVRDHSALLPDTT